MESQDEDASDDTAPCFADLPMEIILHIFEYLNPADRKAVSTVCRRWYDAFVDPKFQSRFILKLCNKYLSSTEQPLLSFLNSGSNRPFINVYLKKVELGAIDAFFEYIGPDVEELTFDSMDISEHRATAILKELRHLQRLSIKQCPEIFMSGQFLKSDKDKKLLFHVFKNLQALTIQDNRYLTDAILSRIVAITPHLRHLNLAGSPIAFHKALCRRFYPASGTGEPSESILTFRFVREVIVKYCDTLKELDLSQTLIGSEALQSLADIDPAIWQLDKLVLRSCLQLTLNSLSQFLSAQTHITHLDCSSINLVTDNWAGIIVGHLPRLQSLKLSNCRTLSDCDIEKIATLLELRILDLSYCGGLTSAGIVQGIAKRRNHVLLELNLSGLNINESCLIACIENFPNLHNFEIAHCVTAVTDFVIQAIIKNLIWLRVLNLENCNLITDTGITRIERSAKKSNKPESSEYLSMIDSNRTSNGMKISLRSRAEDEIVADANRKRELLAIIENGGDCVGLLENTGYSIKRLRGLRSLNLSGCNKITDISLKYGLEFCELATLHLSNCQQISFSGIQVLLQNCPSIENLHLSNCCNINDLTIELIAMKLKRLRFIDIRGCRQLTENYINDIHFHCKMRKV